MSERAPAPLLRRLWLYQAERFPLLRHGLLIAVFTAAAAGYAAALGARPDWREVLGAGAVVLLLFLQLRIADEHKDFQDDLRFRPERPVPRGLVTLAKLRAVAAFAAAVQLASVFTLGVRTAGWLALVWMWMGLMTVEFFAPRQLKARPLLYLVSHMAVMPLIALFALAAMSGGSPPLGMGLAAFLALSLFNGLALELGRKTWAPADEREGVETYSRLWGPAGAAGATAAALLCATAAALLALACVDALRLAPLPLAAVAGALAAVGVYAARRTSRGARALEAGTALFALASYLSLALACWVGG